MGRWAGRFSRERDAQECRDVRFGLLSIGVFLSFSHAFLSLLFLSGEKVLTGQGRAGMELRGHLCPSR